jgi:hypothetical protein
MKRIASNIIARATRSKQVPKQVYLDKCKQLCIKPRSGSNKNELNELISAVLIQRFIRKQWIKDSVCPISYEPVVYPCFCFHARKVKIYYNLEPLRDFIIKTGDFKDPSTKIPFTTKDIEQIDILCKYNKLKKIPGYPSGIMEANNNIRFYDKIKQRESEQLTIERILDFACDNISRILHSGSTGEQIDAEQLATYYQDYKSHFRLLKSRSSDHAKYIINKHIDSLEKDIGSICGETASYLYIINDFYNLREMLVPT